MCCCQKSFCTKISLKTCIRKWVAQIVPWTRWDKEWLLWNGFPSKLSKSSAKISHCQISQTHRLTHNESASILSRIARAVWQKTMDYGLFPGILTQKKKNQLVLDDQLSEICALACWILLVFQHEMCANKCWQLAHSKVGLYVLRDTLKLGAATQRHRREGSCHYWTLTSWFSQMHYLSKCHWCMLRKYVKMKVQYMQWNTCKIVFTVYILNKVYFWHSNNQRHSF